MDPATPLQPYLPPANAGPAPLPSAPLQQAPLSPAGQPPQSGYPQPPAGYPPVGTAVQPANAGFQPPITPTSYPPLPPASNNPLPSSFPPGLPQSPAGNSFDQPAPDGAALNIKDDLIEKLRGANNVLVTVSNNPTVDQLSAAIGLTLVLNKLDKHATAVYSGQTPPAIEFLQPDKTLEKNTDSLRDFIIALDKAKADKLRYKVEDKFVKIFITPYHTSLSENDLEFSQGDFNVDVVVAIGVHKRDELDEAITAHGRILHDAVTASVNNQQTSDLGTLNWFEGTASSLCEMVVSLIEPLQGDKALLDEQIATAFLTGVVAETDRFSNEKTSPHTMNIAALLMKAGANQQLVSSKLEAPQAIPKDGDVDKKKLDELVAEKGGTPLPTVSKDGSLAIDHKAEEKPAAPAKTLADLERENKSKDEDEGEDGDLAKIHIDDEGRIVNAAEKTKDSGPIAEQPPHTSNMVMQPPTLGGDLSSATKAESTSVAAVDSPAQDTTLSPHGKTIEPLTEADKGQTLAQIEETVGSPHVANADALNLPPVPDQTAAARQAVEAAASAVPDRLEPIAALNAQPVDLKKDQPAPTPAPAPAPVDDHVPTNEEIFPAQIIGPDKGLPPDPTAGAADPSAPPPVPPPLMPTS